MTTGRINQVTAVRRRDAERSARRHGGSTASRAASVRRHTRAETETDSTRRVPSNDDDHAIRHRGHPPVYHSPSGHPLRGRTNKTAGRLNNLHRATETWDPDNRDTLNRRLPDRRNLPRQLDRSRHGNSFRTSYRRRADRRRSTQKRLSPCAGTPATSQNVHELTGLSGQPAIHILTLQLATVINLTRNRTLTLILTHTITPHYILVPKLSICTNIRYRPKIGRSCNCKKRAVLQPLRSYVSVHVSMRYMYTVCM